MPAYMEEWTAGAGSDNFSNDPPNATLSVYENGSPENTLVVVEISNQVIKIQLLCYKKSDRREMSKSGEETVLFIDWVDAGGGVAPVYHGVGAGTRGAGLTGGYGDLVR